jgi:KAP family P-loop domain
MKIIVPPFAVAEDDGFKADLFGRKEFGQSLLNLTVNSDDSLVISLDGKWGEGKSTFIKQWRGLAKSEKVASIYIDVFENDYVDDAFIAIASAINAFIKIECSSDVFRTEFQKGAVRVGKQLLTMGAKVAIKFGTLGALDLADVDALTEHDDEIADATSDKLSDIIKEQLNSHEANTQSVAAFKKLLGELPSKITDNSKEKLMIVLDELDRCRPSFAVEILERVKHLFSVPNVYFLLVMNKSQLEAAVKCVYGNEIDAHAYLQKFINVEVMLPKRKLKHASDLNNYGSRLLEVHGLDRNKFDDVKWYVCLLAEYYDLSLRELEKVFTNLVILSTTFGNSHSPEGAPLIAALCVLKVHKPVVFEKLSKGSMHAQDFTKEADLQRVVQGNELEEVLNFFQAFLLDDAGINALPNTDRVNQIALSRSTLRGRGFARDKIIPFHCEKLSIFVVN